MKKKPTNKKKASNGIKSVVHGSFKIHPKIKVRRGDVFGQWLELPLDMEKHDVIIVCTNTGRGLRPVSVLLPHQLYRKDIKEMFANDCNIEEITVIPARAADYIDVAKEKNNYIRNGF